MRFAITGLAKSGKTTLFNLLCGTEHDTGKFAATIEEVRRGIAVVPEPRLPKVTALIGAPKQVPATIDFLDFAGLSLGAEKESKLLGDLRTVDAIVHVVRAFEDPELPHPAGSIDPARDAAAQETEMALNDLIVVENRLPRLEAHIAKARSDELLHEKEVLLKVKSSLEADRPLRELDFDPEELKLIRGYGFLSAKPLLIALNVGEDEIGEMASAAGRWIPGRFAEKRLVAVSPLSAKLEMEIGRLEEADRVEFMSGIGLDKLGSERLLRDAYRLLGLITFFTGNEKEARAWPLRRGSSALDAAGTVHTDMARGFIRAEVIRYDDFLAAGSFSKARELGTLRVEGRDYAVCDGDIINIRFNV